MHILKNLIGKVFARRNNTLSLKIGSSPLRTLSVSAPAVVRQIATVGSGRIQCNYSLIRQALQQGWQVICASSSASYRDVADLQLCAKDLAAPVVREMHQPVWRNIDSADHGDEAVLANHLAEADFVFVRCTSIYDASLNASRTTIAAALHALTIHFEKHAACRRPTLLVCEDLFLGTNGANEHLERVTKAAYAAGAVVVFGDSLPQLDSDAIDSHITHSMYMGLRLDDLMLLRPAHVERIEQSGLSLEDLGRCAEGTGAFVTGRHGSGNVRSQRCRFDYYIPVRLAT
jgi:hypothetical protein